MKRNDQGILIVFEGIDGSGKTTQAVRVTDWLRDKGLPVLSFSEPTQGTYGKKLREIMHHGRKDVTAQEELDLFLKDREEDIRKNILPALSRDFIVIMDRYYYSNMAYQGALGIDVNLIRSLNEKIAPSPDMVVIIDIDVQLGLHRINTLRQEKENHFEKAEYLKKVSQIFSLMGEDYIHHVQGALPLEEMNAQIDRLVLNVLRRNPKWIHILQNPDFVPSPQVHLLKREGAWYLFRRNDKMALTRKAYVRHNVQSAEGILYDKMSGIKELRVK